MKTQPPHIKAGHTLRMQFLLQSSCWDQTKTIQHPSLLGSLSSPILLSFLSYRFLLLAPTLANHFISIPISGYTSGELNLRHPLHLCCPPHAFLLLHQLLSSPRVPPRGTDAILHGPIKLKLFWFHSPVSILPPLLDTHSQSKMQWLFLGTRKRQHKENDFTLMK